MTILSLRFPDQELHLNSQGLVEGLQAKESGPCLNLVGPYLAL